MTESPDDKLLCYCKNVRYGVVRQVIAERELKTPEQVTAVCDAGSGCRSCRPEIEALLEERRRRTGGRFRWLLRLFVRSGDSA